jgi:hypothetical protein
MAFTYPRVLDPNYIFTGASLPTRSFDKGYDEKGRSFATCTALAAISPTLLELGLEKRKTAGIDTYGHLVRVTKQLFNANGDKRLITAQFTLKRADDAIVTLAEMQEVTGLAMMAIAGTASFDKWISGQP